MTEVFTAPFKYLNLLAQIDGILSARQIGAFFGGAGKLMLVLCVNLLLGIIGWIIIGTVGYLLFKGMRERY